MCAGPESASAPLTVPGPLITIVWAFGDVVGEAQREAIAELLPGSTLEDLTRLDGDDLIIDGTLVTLTGERRDWTCPFVVLDLALLGEPLGGD